ncbi:MAG: RluA family pseudouridine synthase [Treponema sp.]|nr:RluA family pseudouridine synthase [Treponema sp.]
MKNIDILHEDDISIIVNKPAGLAVQGGKEVKSSLDKILAQYGKDILLVHRLDKETSGVLLAAKGRDNAAYFSRLFEGAQGFDKKIKKIYTAVCSGHIEKDGGIITDELVIKGVRKKSETKYNVLKRDNLKESGVEYTVVELEPGTGRMHQIRRHLAMIGNPVIGDDKYGDFQLNKKLKKDAGVKRLLLHAARLVIDDKIKLDIQAPLPVYFNHFYN